MKSVSCHDTTAFGPVAPRGALRMRERPKTKFAQRTPQEPPSPPHFVPILFWTPLFGPKRRLLSKRTSTLRRLAEVSLNAARGIFVEVVCSRICISQDYGGRQEAGRYCLCSENSPKSVQSRPFTLALGLSEPFAPSAARYSFPYWPPIGV